MDLRFRDSGKHLEGTGKIQLRHFREDQHANGKVRRSLLHGGTSFLIYERLGFQRYCGYVEAMAIKRA